MIIISEQKVHTFDLSSSGLTIREAAQRLLKISNTKVILNVGSEDILGDRQLLDMQQEFLNLIRICDERNIQVVITTLAPLANYCHIDYMVQKWKGFNEFLKNFSSTHKVIDIVPSMVSSATGKIIFETYKR